MSMHFKSLNELGGGSWKVNGESKKHLASLVKPPLKNQTKKVRAKEFSPHEILWKSVSAIWPAAQYEYENSIPNRKFRLDIAFPESFLAVEVDGWQFHGMHKAGFHKDREKQNLLTENNWRILRFTAKEINQNLAGCIESIQRTLLKINPSGAK